MVIPAAFRLYLLVVVFDFKKLGCQLNKKCFLKNKPVNIEVFYHEATSIKRLND